MFGIFFWLYIDEKIIWLLSYRQVEKIYLVSKLYFLIEESIITAKNYSDSCNFLYLIITYEITNFQVHAAIQGQDSKLPNLSFVHRLIEH